MQNGSSNDKEFQGPLSSCMAGINLMAISQALNRAEAATKLGSGPSSWILACLGTLERTAGLENDLQQLSMALDCRTLGSVASGECVVNDSASIDAFLRASQSAAKSYKQVWEWMATLLSCLGTHLRISADYHAFHNDLYVCETGLTSLLALLRRSATSRPRSAANIAAILQDLMATLLSLQDLASDLCERARSISPLEDRVHLDRPRRGRLLADYATDEMDLACGQVVLVESLASTAKFAKEAEVEEDVEEEEGMWRVHVESLDRPERPFICIVPSILILLEPADSRALEAALRLRGQFLAGWRDTLEAMRRELLRTMTHSFALGQLAKSSDPSADQCLAVLRKSNQLLHRPNDGLYEEFSHGLSSLMSDLNNDDVAATEDANLQKHWADVKRAINHFEDLESYTRHFAAWSNDGSPSVLTVMKEQVADIRYKTSAYIQPLDATDNATLPRCTENGDSPHQADDAAAEVQEHLILEEKPPTLSASYVITQAMDEAEVIATPSESDKRLVIVGVRDPRQPGYVSIYKAVADGLVDEIRGVYVDPVSGEEMPIGVAMDQQIIKADMLDRSLSPEYIEAHILANTDVPFSTHNKELVGIVDAGEDRLLDLETAKGADIVSADLTVVKDTASGKYLPMAEAARLGRALWRPRDAADEWSLEKAAPDAVVAPDGSARLSLGEAQRCGIVDLGDQKFRLDAAGLEMPLWKAVDQGLVRVESPDDEGESIRAGGNNYFLLHEPLESDDVVDGPAAPSVNLSVLRALKASELSEAVGPLASALDDGLLSSDPLLFRRDASSPLVGLPEAALDGVVEPSKAFDLLDRLAAASAENSEAARGLCEDGKLSPEAVRQLASRLDDPRAAFLFDPRLGTIVSVARAAEMADEAKREGVEMAWLAKVPATELKCRMRQLQAMEALGHDVRVAADPTVPSLATAMLHGSLSLTPCVFCPSPFATNSAMALPRAVSEGAVSPALAHRLATGAQLLSVASALERAGHPLGASEAAHLDRAGLEPLLQRLTAPPDCLLLMSVDPVDVSAAADSLTSPGNDIESALSSSANHSAPLADATHARQQNALGSAVTHVDQLDNAPTSSNAARVLLPRVDADWLLTDTLPLGVALELACVLPSDNIDLPQKGESVEAGGQSSVPISSALEKRWINMDNAVRLPEGLVQRGTLSPASEKRLGALLLGYAGEPTVVELLRELEGALKWIGDTEDALVKEEALSRSCKGMLRVKERLEAQKAISERTVVDQERVTMLLKKAKEHLGEEKGKEKKKNGDQVDGGYPEQMTRLKEVTEDLETRFDKIYEQFRSRLKGLHSVSHTLDEFQAAVDDYHKFSEQVETKLEETAAGEKEQDPQDLQKQLSERDPNVFRVTRLGSRLGSSVDEYEDGLTQYRTNFGLGPVEPAEPADGEEQEETFEEVVAAVRTKQQNLKQRANEAQEGAIAAQRRAAIAAELEALAAVAKDPNATPEALQVAIVRAEELQGTPEGAQLSAAAASLRADLAAALERQQTMQRGLDSARSKLAATKALLAGATAVSLDPARLEEQLSGLQREAKALSGLEQGLERVGREAERCRTAGGPTAGASEALEEVEKARGGLLAELKALETECAARTADVIAVRDQRAAILAALDGIADWAAHVGEGEEMDGEAVLAERKELAGELAKAEEAAQALLGRPDVADKEALRGRLAEVQELWWRVGERAAENCLSQVSEHLTVIEDDLLNIQEALTSLPPPPSEQELVALQIKKLEDMAANVSSASEQLEPLGSSVRAAIGELPDSAELAHSVRIALDHCNGLARSLAEQCDSAITDHSNILPLVAAYDAKRDEIGERLDELESDLNALPPSVSELSSDELRRNIEAAKALLEALSAEDAQLNTLDENATVLANLLDCPEEMASVEAEQAALRGKLRSLQDGGAKRLAELENTLKERHDAVHDVCDALRGHLDAVSDLRQRLSSLEPPSARTEQLSSQLEETGSILSRLSAYMADIERLREAATTGEGAGDEEELSEAKELLAELEAACGSLRNDAINRSGVLEDVLSAAKDFWEEVMQLEDHVGAIQDDADAIHADSSDPNAIEEHVDLLSAQQKRLDAASELFRSKVEPRGHALLEKCGCSGRLEVEKVLDDLRDVLEESDEDIREKRLELEEACALARRYQERVKKLTDWFPRVTTKLQSMKEPKMDIRSIRISLEELKVLRGFPDARRTSGGPIPAVFKVEVLPHLVDIEGLNQEANELLGFGGLRDEAEVLETVRKLNDEWSQLINACTNKERDLQESLVRVGELDMALDEVIGILQEVECQLGDYDAPMGDSKFVETCLKNLQLLNNGVINVRPTVRQINDAMADLGKKSPDGVEDAQLLKKTKEMNVLQKEVQLKLAERMASVQGRLRQVKLFSQDVEECSRWLDYFKLSLRHAPPMGARPATAQRSLDRYMSQYATLKQRQPLVESMMAKGRAMLENSSGDRAIALRNYLSALDRKWRSTNARAAKRRTKMERHLECVRRFDAEMSRLSLWLKEAQLELKRFKNPSKITERVQGQIREHQGYLERVEKEKEALSSLSFTGTYLKYFGSKAEALTINGVLTGLQLQYKKLLRRIVERGRVLEQAFREDKRFSSTWETLCSWLETNREQLTHLQYTDQTVKENLDKMKLLIAQITSRYPQYYTTLRLGRNLKERCTRSDPEREELQAMLDALRAKWAAIRDLVFKRKSELDERLLATGLVSEAIAAVLEWLEKIEGILRPDQPLLGDLDTLELLMEQNRGIGEELSTHDRLIESLGRSATRDADAEAVERLKERWAAVGTMYEEREKALKAARERAEAFQRLVQKMKEWLPPAEKELQYKRLPDTENEILRLKEQHERFQKEMAALAPDMAALATVGAEILACCHPNALRYVRGDLQNIESRWRQAELRSASRAEKLSMALKAILGNAAKLEEMLTWVTECHTNLLEWEKKDLPPLPELEKVVQEHRDLHERLGTAAHEVERLAAAAANAELRRGSARSSTSSSHIPTPTRYPSHSSSTSSTSLPPHDDPFGERCQRLQTKYRHAWRLSVARKKRLADALDAAMEDEAMRRFNFEEWRQRYLQWIRERRLRLTDVFRRQDRDGSGTLGKEEFVEGMMKMKFPSTRKELEAVFAKFDRRGKGEIEYTAFMDALRPDRKDRQAHRSAIGKKVDKTKSDAQMIHDEIEREVSHCQCEKQFQVKRISEGKYQFGEGKRLYLVRFLNSCVMVRVGGGWVTLQEFLRTHDPCRAKGRTNTELRENFTLADGVSQSRMPFSLGSRSRTGSTSSLNSVGSAGSKRTTAGTAAASGRRTPTSQLTPSQQIKYRRWDSMCDLPTSRAKSPLSSSSSLPMGSHHSHQHPVQPPRFPRRGEHNLEALNGLSSDTGSSSHSHAAEHRPPLPPSGRGHPLARRTGSRDLSGSHTKQRP